MSAEPKQKIGVMICTPVRYWKGLEQFHPVFQETLKILSTLTSDEECPYEFMFSSTTGGIVKARNELVANFRKQRIHNLSLKWLLWLDDDVFATNEKGEPDAVAQVAAILRLLSHKRPVCGALYVTRDDHERWAANFMFEAKPDEKGLLQGVELACGMKLHHFQVFDILQELYPRLRYFRRDTGEEVWGFFQQVVMNDDAPSEDYFLDWLCRQSTKSKIGIWIDTDTKLVHVAGDTQYPKDGIFPPIPGIE